MFNTIILKKGYASLTKKEMATFDKGDAIIGIDRDTEELQRWSGEQKAEALEELKKYKCSYNEWGNGVDVTEYALEFCDVDEDGDFVQGSDFELAEEE